MEGTGLVNIFIFAPQILPFFHFYLSFSFLIHILALLPFFIIGISILLPKGIIQGITKSRPIIMMGLATVVAIITPADIGAFMIIYMPLMITYEVSMFLSTVSRRYHESDPPG